MHLRRFLVSLVILSAAPLFGFGQTHPLPTPNKTHSPPPVAANDVLVLIEPDRYDPAVDPTTYIHPTWVRWPEPSLRADDSSPSSAGGGDSRLLSIMSGVDWRTSIPLSQFRSARNRKELPTAAFQSLTERGYFRARTVNLRGSSAALLVGRTGAASVSALLLALNADSPSIALFGLDDAWPTGCLMVLKANGGDDVKAVARRTTGRVLVVEYPPKSNAASSTRPIGVGSAGGPNWSRLWLVPPGRRPSPFSSQGEWPPGLPQESGVGIPGLVQASSLAALVLRPEDFSWHPASPAWSGANRWFVFVQSTRPATELALFIVFGALVCLVASRAAQEKRSLVLCGAARAFSVVPAAMVLGGNLARLGGLSGGAVWMGVAWLGLIGVASVINFVAARASAWEPLVGYAFVGFAALLLLDPRYSMLGSVFEHGPIVFPGEAFGATIGAFAVLTATLGARGGGGVAVGVLVVFLLIASGASLNPWWWGGTLPFGAWWLVAAAAGLEWRRFSWSVVPIASAMRLWALGAFGLSFLPPGLVDNLRQIGSVNLAEIPRFLLSPVMIGSFFLTTALALYASRFLAHQVRAVWRDRAPARILAVLTVGCLAGGLVEPAMLRAGGMCAFSVVLVVLEDLMRPRELVD